MNGHTYMLEDGYWRAEGRYWDEHGLIFPFLGNSSITLIQGYTVLESRMQILAQPPIEIDYRYEIMPTSPIRATMTWTAHNTAFGYMSGLYTVVDRSILAQFKTDSGRFSGFEFFFKLNDETYESEGAIFEGRRRNAAWAVVLKRD